jgi:hypothetical protein
VLGPVWWKFGLRIPSERTVWDLVALHVVASTFPNFGGTDQKGTVTVKGDSLTLVREILGGVEPFTSTLELTRMK